MQFYYSLKLEFARLKFAGKIHVAFVAKIISVKTFNRIKRVGIRAVVTALRVYMNEEISEKTWATIKEKLRGLTVLTVATISMKFRVKSNPPVNGV